MNENIVNLDEEEIYLPKDLTFVLNGKEYSIPRPTIRRRMEYLRVGKSIQSLDDPEEAMKALIKLCLVAVDGMEEEDLLDCTEKQLAKIVDMISIHYGITGEEDNEGQEKNLPMRPARTKNKKKKG